MIFNADEAHNIVKECIESVLGKADYNHNKVNQWTAAIVEQSLTHLVKLGKTYKYIVTCAVMQRSGAGLHTASSCFWDTTTDGTCTVRWENRTMNCIVNKKIWNEATAEKDVRHLKIFCDKCKYSPSTMDDKANKEDDKEMD
ncbi:hypothetical protein IHE44_0005003 [Lamprotornis superbus]|uniref:Dynein light chain Tctex-type 3 n=1 Tax=Lamprotornis superbus TaxID=245042 RepID=A0A835TNI4_9PASS|nr:hypothetical protein IHE44_0005003 [Lamprotornis superbus]